MIRLENVLKRCLQHVLKTSSRRLQNVMNKSWRRLEDVLKMSWIRLEDVLKTLLQDVLKMCDQDNYVGLDQDVLKTSSENVWVRRIYSFDQDVLKTSWRLLLKTKTKDVFKTSSSRRMFAGFWRLEWMKYFRVSLVTDKSLFFLFQNLGNDEDVWQDLEWKQRRWNWNNFV